MSVQRMLEAGLDRLNLFYTPIQLEQLLAYADLLEKWNRVFNLIATHDRERIVSHHILDSLSVIPYIRKSRILDVGSGAGLPGIPLAVMQPDCGFVLLDSNGKKTRFLNQATLEVSITNRVEIVKCRIEEYRPDQPFDTVISRAFAGLEDFVEAGLRLCDRHSIMLAMKGRRPDAELELLGSRVDVVEIAAVAVPGVKAERHIVCLKKVSDGK